MFLSTPIRTVALGLTLLAGLGASATQACEHHHHTPTKTQAALATTQWTGIPMRNLRSMAPQNSSCYICGGSGMWTGRTETHGAKIFKVMKCIKGHLWLER